MTNEELSGINNSLERMLLITGDLLEEIVSSQSEGIRIHYTDKIQYLCLVLQNASKEELDLVRWQLFRPSENGRVWIFGWTVDKLPRLGIKNRMDRSGVKIFKKIDSMTLNVHKVRKELFAKKRRLQAIAKAISDFEEKDMQQMAQLVVKSLDSDI